MSLFKRKSPIEPLLKDYIEEWDRVCTHDQKKVLRTALLRNIARDLHKRRSLFMSKGHQEEIKLITALEPQVLSLALHQDCDKPLLEALEDDLTSLNQTRSHLPSEIEKVIPFEKLDRFDRTWEKLLAKDAYESQWAFWNLHASVDTTMAETFHLELEKKLWSNAIVLFVETDLEAMQSNPTSNQEGLVWPGVWFLASEPQFDLTHFPFDNLAGLSKKNPRSNLIKLYPKES